MNKDRQRVAARFAPDTRFKVPTAPVAPFRATEVTELEHLKNRLLLTRLTAATEPEVNAHLRRAANDAAALAWATQFPLLVFPALFEEKALVAARTARRQAWIRERSAELLAA
jgi:hypothetical protein